MSSLDDTVADILGLPPEALLSDRRAASRRKMLRLGAAVTMGGLVLASLGGAAFIVLMRASPRAPPALEARLVSRSRTAAVPPHQSLAPITISKASPFKDEVATSAPLHDGASSSSDPTPSVVPPPPPPPDAQTVARLKAERLVVDKKVALAPATPPLKLPHVERLAAAEAALHVQLTPPASHQFEPTWVDQPSDREVERAYPSAALAADAPGSVVLECRERVDGSVDQCEVLQEMPLGAGFGRAALKLSRSFRFTPFRVDGHASEINVEIPYDFDIRD